MHCIKTYTYCRWLVPALVGLASTVAGPALAQTTSAPLVCTGQLYQLTAGNSATSDTQIWEIGSDYRQGSAPLFTVPGVGLDTLASCTSAWALSAWYRYAPSGPAVL